jgi:hypothetical protein
MKVETKYLRDEKLRWQIDGWLAEWLSGWLADSLAG